MSDTMINILNRLRHSELSLFGTADVDFLIKRISSLEAELARVREVIEPMRNQITDALQELPKVAGPLAHRIRFMRDQYDGWCKEYKKERDEARREIDALCEALRKLRNIGSLMSNVCFNLSQDQSIEQRHRETMKQLQMQWDAALLEPKEGK